MNKYQKFLKEKNIYHRELHPTGATRQSNDHVEEMAKRGIKEPSKKIF